MAKVCANCGYEFPVTVVTPLDSTEKICPKCGHANRPGAKICSQCGTALPVGAPPPAPTPAVGATITRAKKCPECGMVCKLDAKVCPNCGHRFQTDFSQPVAPPSPAITEPPVVQMPSVGMALPTQYDDRTHYADLPPDPAPPTPAPAVPTAPTPDASANANPNVTADAVSDGDTSGEPAPDLTELDIDALRRRSPENNDSSGRVNISFRKDRP